MEVKLDKMSLKAKLPIWVFILVAGIGIAMIFLLLQYRDSIFDEMKLQSIEDAYWTKIIPQKDTLAGWKTYRNEEYGFEFKYPKKWEDMNRNIAIQNFFIISGSEVSPLQIELGISNTNDTLPEIADNDIRNNNCPPGDHIIKSTENGVMYVLYCSAMSENYIYIFRNPEGQIIKIIYNDDEKGWSELKKIENFNQILSTFKFTGSNLPITESNLPMGCKNLWWYDNEHSTCQQPKQFCGAYMYYGLQTFETKEECEISKIKP